MRSPLWFVVAGVIALAGLVVAGLYAAPRLGALDQGTIRIVVPGDAVLALEKPGHYTIFHERRSVVDDRYYASDSVDGLRVTLAAEGSGAPVALGQPKMSSSYEMGSRVGESVFDFDIARPGRYRLTATLANGAAEPRMVLAVSQAMMGGLFQMVFRAIGIVFGGFGIAVVLVVIVLMSRRKRPMGEA